MNTVCHCSHPWDTFMERNCTIYEKLQYGRWIVEFLSIIAKFNVISKDYYGYSTL